MTHRRRHVTNGPGSSQGEQKGSSSATKNLTMMPSWSPPRRTPKTLFGDVFLVTPFGVFCHLCNTKVSGSAQSIQRHVKAKHQGMYLGKTRKELEELVSEELTEASMRDFRDYIEVKLDADGNEHPLTSHAKMKHFCFNCNQSLRGLWRFLHKVSWFPAIRVQVVPFRQ